MAASTLLPSSPSPSRLPSSSSSSSSRLPSSSPSSPSRSPSSSSSSSSSKIRRLDVSVVNRIAAGEVIQRPENAIKELLENSIDAGATSITITVKGGGLKLLQIQDDGCGISYEDLFLVCERFTTSKLTNFEDLQSIQTFGFRGEALASMSHVSHLTITSRTQDQVCAYRAKYIDGVLVNERGGGEAKPVGIAGVKGTCITIEDLFYNVLTRKNALKNQAEEYNRILQVVMRYALHFPHIAFGCKKHGSNTMDVQTQKAPSSLSPLRLLFGNELANSALSFTLSPHSQPSNDRLTSLGLEATGLISSPSYHKPKGTFILFINHRLVDCTHLKKAIEAVYQSFLPKHSHPFVYLSLLLPPHTVDVNVHPTKKEVHFLMESDVIEAIQGEVEACLKGVGMSRVFTTQLSLPHALSLASSASALLSSTAASSSLSSSSSSSSLSSSSILSSSSSSTSHTSSQSSLSTPTKRRRVGGDESEPIYPYQKIRTDARTQTLDLFVGSQSMRRFAQAPSSSPSLLRGSSSSASSSSSSSSSTLSIHSSTSSECIPSSASSQNVMHSISSSSITPSSSSSQSSCDVSMTEEGRGEERGEEEEAEDPENFISIQNLKRQMEMERHDELCKIFKNHIFVGSANARFSLIQHMTKLYLVDVPLLTEEIIYQKTVRNFAKLPKLALSPSIDIKWLLHFGHEKYSKSDIFSIPLSEAETIPRQTIEMTSFLIGKSEMLSEYFGIDIASEGTLTSLPLPLLPLPPLIENIHLFLSRLLRNTDWEREEECFRDVSRAIAALYTVRPSVDLDSLHSIVSSQDLIQKEHGDPSRQFSFKWIIEHAIFPAARSFVPSKRLASQRVVCEVACLENLYKIFERC